MSTFKGRLLTDGLITLLSNAGILIGSGDKPAGGGWQGSPGGSAFVPYTVIYPVTGGWFDGTLGDPYGDARPDYIISSFGATPQQAQFNDDLVYATLTTSKPTVSGQTVELATPEVHGGTVRDDDVTPPVYNAPTRWRFYLTPA